MSFVDIVRFDEAVVALRRRGGAFVSGVPDGGAQGELRARRRRGVVDRRRHYDKVRVPGRRNAGVADQRLSRMRPRARRGLVGKAEVLVAVSVADPQHTADLRRRAELDCRRQALRGAVGGSGEVHAAQEQFPFVALPVLHRQVERREQTLETADPLGFHQRRGHHRHGRRRGTHRTAGLSRRRGPVGEVAARGRQQAQDRDRHVGPDLQPPLPAPGTERTLEVPALFQLHGAECPRRSRRHGKPNAPAAHPSVIHGFDHHRSLAGSPVDQPQKALLIEVSARVEVDDPVLQRSRGIRRRDGVHRRDETVRGAHEGQHFQPQAALDLQAPVALARAPRASDQPLGGIPVLEIVRVDVDRLSRIDADLHRSVFRAAIVDGVDGEGAGLPIMVRDAQEALPATRMTRCGKERHRLAVAGGLDRRGHGNGCAGNLHQRHFRRAVRGRREPKKHRGKTASQAGADFSDRDYDARTRVTRCRSGAASAARWFGHGGRPKTAPPGRAHGSARLGKIISRASTPFVNPRVALPRTGRRSSLPSRSIDRPRPLVPFILPSPKPPLHFAVR